MVTITPLPIGKIIVSSCILFTNSFMFSVLLPFLSFMISDFNIAPNEDEIGRYSGYLVGSFMLGQFLFSYTWGHLSDIYGRRPIILCALLLTGFSFMIFGFSTSYTMAVLLRLLNGSFNGIVGVTKTYMSEITDVTNQSQGFGIFGVARGLGVVAGPIVGGYLYKPSTKYPKYFPKGSLFDQFPYALPCVIGALIVFLGFILAAFVLEESHQNPKNIKEMLWSFFGKTSELEREPLIENGSTSGSTFAEETRDSIFVILKRQKVFLSLLSYGAVTFIYIQFDEIFALWSRLPVEEGGLDFDSSDQGTAYSIGGLTLLIYQLFVFARVERALGVLKTFRFGILFSIPAFIIMPMCGHFLLHDGSSEWLVWTLVGICQALRNIFGVQAFTATFMMISNSVSSKHRGGLNGFGQTFAAFSRMIGPVFGGYLFSWSLENGLGAPFDFHFVYFLLAVLLSIVFLMSFMISDEINTREIEDEEEIVVDE